MHVLLVEDDEVDIQSVERALKKLNLPIELHIARDGKEALDLLLEGQSPFIPQLIILDINMPKMNGIEFLRKLRSNPDFNFVNIIVFTTSNDQQDKLSALSLNIAGYILKPLQVDDFLPLCQLLLKA